MDAIGKYLTPTSPTILFFLIFVVEPFFNQMQAYSKRIELTFAQGFKEGYQTMDTRSPLSRSGQVKRYYAPWVFKQDQFRMMFGVERGLHLTRISTDSGIQRRAVCALSSIQLRNA